MNHVYLKYFHKHSTTVFGDYYSTKSVEISGRINIMNYNWYIEASWFLITHDISVLQVMQELLREETLDAKLKKIAKYHEKISKQVNQLFQILYRFNSHVVLNTSRTDMQNTRSLVSE